MRNLEAESKYYQEEKMFHGYIPYIMGTRFDMVVIHADQDKMNRLWQHILREMSHWEHLMNRYDARSEAARINRRAPSRSFSVSKEMVQILRLCQDYRERTMNLFDVTLGSIPFEIQDDTRVYQTSQTSLDFGGFAKGYALQKIVSLLKEKGIEDAFVDFGNSSIVGLGHHPYGDCWKVSLINPYSQEPVGEFELRDTALSVSGNSPQNPKHILNPLSGKYIVQKRACAIVSSDALDAEVLSTTWLLARPEQRDKIRRRFKEFEAKIYNL
jgi:thiamine biosynthesis lipoprotein